MQANLGYRNACMRLLISANSFYPAVGGYEGVAFTIAHQLTLRRHEVKIITFTPGDGCRAFHLKL